MSAFGGIGGYGNSLGGVLSGAAPQVMAKTAKQSFNNPFTDPDFQQRFADAASKGYFGPPDPYGVNALVNSDAYKAAGNNNQQYDQAYQNAIAAQRSNITQMYGAAFQDIANRQAAGDQAIAALPGQISAAYAPAQQQVDASAQAAEQGQKASGLATFMPASAISAPTDAALATSQAAHQADVPVLHQAINTELGSERTKLQGQQAGDMASIDKQEADRAASKADSGPNWMQQLMIQNQVDSQKAKAAGDLKTQQALIKQKGQIDLLKAKTSTISPKSGKTYMGSQLAATQVNKIKSGQAGRTSKAYFDALNSIGGQMNAEDQQIAAAKKAGKKPNISADGMAKLYNRLIHDYPQQGSAISMALADLNVNDGDWATITRRAGALKSSKPKKK